MNSSEQVDVCIIGAGVAGAMAASRLAQQGFQVLVLEAGPRHDLAKRYDYMRQNLYDIDPWISEKSDSEIYSPELQRWVRVNAVGGSGLHWGANVDRLHESDFELRSRYGIGFDWPMRYKDLEPYYTQAEKLIGVAGQDAYPWTPWRTENYPMPPFPFSYSDQILKTAFDRREIPLHHNPVARNSVPYNGRSHCMSFAMCDTCPIFAKWTPDLLIVEAEKTGKVLVKPNTRVTRINYNKTGAAVESVTAATFIDGRPQYKDYHARMFVLAAHAIESTRLLLLSGATAESRGIGLKSGFVGKYFATHLSVTMGAELKEKTYLERVGFATAQSQYFYESSRKDGGNAFVLYLRNRYIEPPFELATKELKERISWGNELRTQVQKRFGNTVAIQALVEQLPYEENQISLDKSIGDDLGLSVPKVTYVAKKERESRALENASAIIRQLFLTLGAKNIRSRITSVATHHMGTCRMGDDPRSSVVDQDLKVHGVDNLFVVGGSVFRTFGAIGPTLTIAALALRLADKIRINMAGSARAN